MSGLGKVPSFEPDEESRALIESLFAKQEVKEEVVASQEEISAKKFAAEEQPKTNITPGKRHRVKIPEAPPQTLEQEKIAVNLAEEELDIIHDAFMKFSEEASDTVIYGYLYGEILKLVESFQDVEATIKDDFNEDDITKNGEAYYDKVRKIRARILNDVYNRYKEGK